MSLKPANDAAAYENKDISSPLLRGKAKNISATMRWERILLSAWFIVNVALGVLTVHQYGVSYDEPNNYRYAADTVAAYRSFFGILYEPAYSPTYDGHGPAFVAGVMLVVNAVRQISPHIFAPDIWHLSYFIAFQLTGLCLYVLMKRWFHTWTAWGILVLFSTQPLLLGYAFINPKDIPFMFFFTLSILLGFRLADGMEPTEQYVSLRAQFDDWVQKYKGAERPKKRFFLHLAIATALVLLLALLSGPINTWIDQAVRSLYHAAPDTFAGRIFSLAANHTSGASAKDYVVKAQRVFQQGERLALLAGVLLFALYFVVVFRASVASAWRQSQKLLPGTAWLSKAWKSVSLQSLKIGLIAVLHELRQPRVIVAGIVLGIATSIRAVAPWAGAIAFLYLFTKVRGRAWATGIAYFVVTAIVMYLTWPRLWGAPLERYLQGIGSISNFSTAQHVLFNGHVYDSHDLPRSYLFTLLNIQFTEPLLLCTYLGIGVLAWQLLKSRVRTDLLIYIGLGFAAPLIGWELLGSPLYDNFRHLLFLTPAMVMLAALTLELAFRLVTRSWVRLLLIAAVAAPGIFASVTLYPYEYIYYNSLVGGVSGAYKLYPVDPWRIALREAALALNEQAPQGAKVLVGDSNEIMRIYTRPDIVLETGYDSAADASGAYNYAVDVPTVKAWSVHHETQEVFSVRRGGVLLVTLKAINNATTK